MSMETAIWFFGMRILMLLWFIFVPVVISARLERIARAIEDLKTKTD